MGGDQDITQHLLHIADYVREEGEAGCLPQLGVCLLSTSMVALNERGVTEVELGSLVARGLAEYLSTGDISDTWKQLRSIKHVRMAAQCLKDYNNCQ